MSSSVNETVSESIARFDFLDPRFQGWERYDFLRELRESEVPLAVDQFGRVNLLRHEDVRRGFLDHQRFRNVETGLVASLGCLQGPLFDWQSHALITQNPPRHTAMRNAIRTINARLARRLISVVTDSAHALIDSFPADGCIDFAEAFAFTLPVSVVMGLLHLPEEDTALIAELSPKTLPWGPDAIEASQQANAQFRAYVEERIQKRRAAPLEDDLLTDLVSAQDRGDITTDELWATVQTLILAGHETSSSALASGMYILLRHSGQWSELSADRSLFQNASEEILRFESPAESMTRILSEDVELHGVRLPQGTMVNLSIASANRDPREFPEPDVFDIRRANAKSQLSFGVGIHRCTGAPLAQMEIPIALGVLLDRLEYVEIDAQPTWRTGFFRQFEELRLGVRVRPRAEQTTP